ncbi:helix-turn-helix domain-containing protein [Pseudovibrio exalbescens]|uniref:helix-turn-helix domain-containing protein n=1 Tax=Pseudovibrio exalbescens TaxID=197461 RepID=UPI000C9AA8ED|nr:helix-turn-helix domain-containing protein [Pseudovibrio exalbescens]
MTDKKQAKKAKMGRPTDWTPELGEVIRQKMEEGLSLAAAAAECGIHRQRVYDWEKRHPDFADTIKLARVQRQAFLERRLLKAEQGPVVTSTIFALKNAAGEDWREKQEIEHSGETTQHHKMSWREMAGLKDKE